ncbi:hypothetical protein SDC9_154059 [bioreactor metagenome]|uniref:Daunorubicin resistance ATP-binding protein DrrA1/2-like C-terminal domain-containing protein n=1 Tax=bioreactor metagenome TaxID=1076179 RepID=A0A645EZX9_9ZZZZ
MEEAADADYVMVIDHGQIVAKGTPYELKDQYSHDRLIIEPADQQALCRYLDQNAIKYQLNNKQLEIQLVKTKDAIRLINDCKDYITAFEVLRGTMDDAFIAITGREIRE